MKTGLVLLGLGLWGCAPMGDQKPSTNEFSDFSEKVIYGEDHRVDLYQVLDPQWLLRARSTVALIDKNDLVLNGSSYSLKGSLFGAAYGLCSTEKFTDQITSAFCSGSLVGPDLVMTAGHCLQDALDCANVRFVFDYAITSAAFVPTQISSDRVYSCAQIIKHNRNDSGADYALVRLDRAVQDRKALQVRREGNVNVGDSLVVIGHPSGLPTKLARGAQVRSNSEAHFFVANLDTFGGNSGSAVFNETTGLIEGILVRGEQDFVANGSCRIAKRCKENECRGEDVTRVSELSALIPDSSGDEDEEPPPPLETYRVSAQPKRAIPDASPAGILSSLSALEIPEGRELQVEIHIQHSFRGDLVVTLTSPSKKTVTLWSRTGGSLDDLRGTFGGDLVSKEDLSKLESETQKGLWTLKVSDRARRDIGTLLSWSLVFR